MMTMQAAILMGFAIFLILGAICISMMRKSKGIEQVDLNKAAKFVKDSLNDFHGERICLHASVDELGGLCEDIEQTRGDIRVDYIVVAKVRLERMDKCVSVIVADVEEGTLKAAVGVLVAKVAQTRKDLQITC